MFVTRVAAVSLLLAGLSGCATLGSNESERYRDQIRVAGFRHVGDVLAQLGAAHAYFVGGADVDVLGAVSGPELALQADDRDLSVGIFQRIASGYGRTDETGKCHVTVERITGDTTAQFLASYGDLTKAEETGLTDGTMVGVKAGVICEAQADR